MPDALDLTAPHCSPELDPGFRPAALAQRAFCREAAAAGGVPLVIGLARPDGSVSRYETVAFPEDHPRARANLLFGERLLKFLLWQRGAAQVHVSGPRSLREHLVREYAPGGGRAFDSRFMGRDVYGRPFAVLPCGIDQVPSPREIAHALGRHLDGCRIGFDLGASDRKVAAVIDGRAVYSEEIVWDPRAQSDPEYHYREVLAGIRAAAAHLPHVDAVGGSAAGVYVDNQPRVASLFRAVPRERFDEIRRLFLRIRDDMGVPLEVINDGEVTALAGSMSLEVNAILGIALGSSEAAGFVTRQGHLTGWLNELAFAPIDYAPDAPLDEWSGDRGVGASYLSQQAVFRLATHAGLPLAAGAPAAERLHQAQERLQAGDERAAAIWRTMGTYLGYALAHYAAFYDVAHVLILGRCTSGPGGTLLSDGARAVLRSEFPDIAQHLLLHLPDEKSRRVGQSIAAASLPALARDEA